MENKEQLECFSLPREGRRYGHQLYRYPKFYYHVILKVASNNLGTYMKSFLAALKASSIQTFQPQSVIYRRGNFVNHQWGCLYIYHPLSYPLVDIDLLNSMDLKG